MRRKGIRARAGQVLRRPGIWAAAWLILLIAGGLLARWIRPSLPMGLPLQPPSAEHWLGTDMLGRDFGWRLLAGGVRTFGLATGAAAVAIVLGGVWGVAAGFLGGRTDRILSRTMDMALAVPALILGLVVLAALGPSETAVVLAVGAGGSATFARLMRSEAARLRNREFMTASRALGAGGFRLAFRHLLPNLTPSLVAYGALHFGWTVMNVASLMFLGFGGAPADPEWGRMLNEARQVFGRAPWQAIAPGSAIALTVLAVQRSGEGWLERGRR